MRRITVPTGLIVLAVIFHFSVSGQDNPVKPAPKAGAQPTPKVPSTVPPKTTPNPTPVKDPVTKAPPVKEPVAETPAAPGQPSPDEVAIRKTAETYLKAFNQGDAKAAADHFTAEAEYIDDQGKLIQGRPAIEKTLKELFAEFPECRFELKIDSIRFVGQGIAIEDGFTTLRRSKNSDPVLDRYTAVHTKSTGKWLVASVRDFAPKAQRQHRVQLQQLDWMLGEWIHEGNDAVVNFSCKSVDNGNFLLRNFTIRIAGQEAMSGSQRIGWDALSGKFQAWVFDSDGGHSEGYWHRDGDNWILKTSGITADGQTASSTSIYSFVNAHTMTFQSVDHEVAGVELPDAAKVTIVRHAPQPE